MANLVNGSAWKNLKVLVTGHTGFKGAWLSLWLKELGANVVGLSLPPEPLSLFRLIQLEMDTQNYYINISNFTALKAAVEEIEPEFIFHLAAQSLVGQSYKDPKETYETNLMGTVNILECMRLTPSVRGCLVVTSDKCYDPQHQLLNRPHKVGDPLGGHDTYSGSKACAEIAAQTYWKSFFSRDNRQIVATARAGNVIGGGDWAEDRLIPDIMRTFIDGKPLLVRNPAAIRPWQHVLDPLYGYLRLASLMVGNEGVNYARPWNFAPHPDNFWSVEQILNFFQNQYPGEFKFENGEVKKYYENPKLMLDSSDTTSELGWSGKLSITDTLQETIDWYQAYKTKSDMRMICQNQIHKYMDLL